MTVVSHIWDTFDLVVLKVILGTFGALVSKWSITRKMPGRKVKKMGS